MTGCRVFGKPAEMLKRVQTNYRVFRTSKRCRAHHDFSEVPPIVIPNLFRDLGVDLIQRPVHDLGRETLDRSCSVRRIFDTRSRADPLNRIFSGQALPSRHPDNALGQDPYPSRKRDVRRIVSPYFRSRLLMSAANVLSLA